MKKIWYLFFLISFLILFYSTPIFTQNNISSTGKAPHSSYFSNFSFPGKQNNLLTFCRYMYYYDATTSMIGRISTSVNCQGGVLALWTPPAFPSAGVEGGNGNFYILCSGQPNLLCRLDTATGTVNILGQISGMGNASANGIAYDAVNSSYYLIGFTGSTNNLYNLDVNTLEATLVSGFNSTSAMIAIAIDSNGVGYGYTLMPDNNAYTFDPVSGSFSVLGSIGFNANYGQDMDIDRETGIIYLAAFNADTFSGELRQMDPATGMTTLIYPFSDQFSVFEFDNLYNVTPVELISFEAKTTDGDVALSWSTATETNNKGFEIEKNPGYGSFQKTAFVEGHGTTTELRHYSYIDKNISPGKYLYRLKQIDLDGTSSYSKEIEVDAVLPLKFSLSQNYPNPFNPITTIKFSIPQKVQVNLTIYDILGEKVKELKNEVMSPGYYEVEFNATDLASGVYFCRIKAGDPSTGSGQVFTQTKKMVLLR
ncbi:MAG TPA: T9SS type A sorting domain-containing protein [Ignavibacteriaceae bacterium]|nr:T9SS type A sorting domain-containing protein [Ignavibacteriaceae bacterium]